MDDGSIELTDDGSIELTMDNYEDYLELNMSIANNGTPTDCKHMYSENGYSQHEYIEGYREIRFTMSVEGVSTHYRYDDITVTGHFEGTYDSFSYFIFTEEDGVDGFYPNNSFAFDITAETNIAGDGEEIYILKDDHYTSKAYFEVEFVVTQVEGTVVPM